ncbi:4Fe-4S dicluster domain-containing protein [Capnocytophaga sp. oral taxon 323]|uniref:4Fe-4S dicluster domain-containing protein n=1 Tax=Capnocytophaga sp. oral taxon 323 TaxID=1705617 RepID=UPI0006AFF1B8|nr:4Fe-4S dicluster domain-containing protein [Capnocytophaga sp. oral taxon 323]ALC98263.1 quinol:cytochrome C oxidoreductase [Capnocytophaga sp. oral taxon 323]
MTKESIHNIPTSRRDFLKFLGFSTAVAALAGCEGAVHKTIPYVIQPESIVAGEANYYATCIADGFDFASVLVKTREGRPIAVLRNPEAKAGGAVNARILASVLSLYDENRKPPTIAGEGFWQKIDTDTLSALEKAKAEGKQIVMLSQTLASPSSYALVELLKEKYPTFKLVEYDTVSEEATLRAFEKRCGLRAMPDYDFSKTKLIVSFDADFLGDWNGGGYEAGYAQGRIPSKANGMSRHIQLEANLSLTGANADERIALTPQQLKVALAQFYIFLTEYQTSHSENLPAEINKKLKAIADEVKKAGSDAVIVTGIDKDNAQELTFALNKRLKSKAFIPETPVFTRKGDIVWKFKPLLTDMNKGKVGVLFINNLNPLYSLPNAEVFISGLKKVPFSVSFAMRADETAQQTTLWAPQPHYLESWGDVEFKYGHYGLMQPCIRPLFNTRQWQDCFLQWIGHKESYYDFIKAHWETHILKGFPWEQALHDGTFVDKEKRFDFEQQEEERLSLFRTKESFTDISISQLLISQTESPFELTLYTSTALGDGQQANNPWLQELPDPIHRTTWDNFLTMHPSDAQRLNIENWHTADGALDGHQTKISGNGKSIIAPVLITPAQAQGSVGLALGYGRKAGIQAEMQIGVNAFPLYKDHCKTQGVQIEKVDGTHEFACLQLQNELVGRKNILKEISLDTFLNSSAEVWNPHPPKTKKAPTTPHHFKLSIDLNACTGCAACVIACHAENNVPVVGKEEVRRSRDMHWLRIDRYESRENEQRCVGFQPVMCQHCNNAPCETVCPVIATAHGQQGQNQMAYNRCVGTRYCANNCPYKVRRFNWFQYSENKQFNYNMNNEIGRMVLNPDVTVRSRGVMEKCSLCIQNTQAVILKAKREGRAVAPGEFNNVVACAAACNTGAMVFGDANEEGSKIAQLSASERMYQLLAELGTDPNVVYQVKVVNSEKSKVNGK